MRRVLRSLLPRLIARPLLPVARPVLLRAPPAPALRALHASRPCLVAAAPAHPAPPPPPQSLSARLKLLIRAYGWYALGVYMVLSALDFGVAFAAINVLGADHVAHYVASIKTFFFNLIGRTPPDAAADAPPQQQQSNGSEGMYAMLVLAWAVHKTLFFPVRVGLTAAVTPRFVTWLTRRGWTGTDGARRAAQLMRERVRRGSSDSPSG